MRIIDKNIIIIEKTEILKIRKNLVGLHHIYKNKFSIIHTINYDTIWANKIAYLKNYIAFYNDDVLIGMFDYTSIKEIVIYTDDVIITYNN